MAIIIKCISKFLKRVSFSYISQGFGVIVLVAKQ